MERRPKFRAWDKENNCWYKPTHKAYEGELFELVLTFSGDLDARTMSGEIHESQFPDRFVVMQWTGRYGKNNVPVFEGDILEFEVEQAWGDPKKVRRAVKWDVYYGASWNFGVSHKDGDKRFSYPFYENMEVVGNIWEHPHLLEANTV